MAAHMCRYGRLGLAVGASIRDVDPERWDFTYVANPMLIRDDPVMLRIVFCGVLFALADPEAPPPLEMAEAVEGLTLEDTQTISLAQTAKIFPRLL
jgi:hypothetical protein